MSRGVILAKHKKNCGNANNVAKGWGGGDRGYRVGG